MALHKYHKKGSSKRVKGKGMKGKAYKKKYAVGKKMR